MKYFISLFCLSLATIANFCCAQAQTLINAPIIHYTIIGERSHKPSLFTEGFLINDNSFYESSGLYQKSQIVSYPIAEPKGTWAKMTAPFTHKQQLPDRFFGEGLSVLYNQLFLLTWKEETVFVYDVKNFSLIKTLAYKGEGWGLTNDGKSLIRSDGSSTLFFHNPENFSLEKTISVKFKQEPVLNINELEYQDGFIWANMWHDNRIIKINPTTGNVVGVLDFSATVKSLKIKDPESVLNGIAYDANKKAFWITGKQWPKMFLVKIQ